MFAKDYADIDVIYEPRHEKTCFMLYTNNKAADLPAHLCSLISSFVISCLDSIISTLAVSKISILWLASVAEQAGLGHTWSQTPKTDFLLTWFKLFLLIIFIICLHPMK